MDDTFYVTSECVATQIVPIDDKSAMDGSEQVQFDIIETVFQVRSKRGGESLSPQDLNDMIQEPDRNLSDNSLDMPISPSKTSALPRISGDNDKIPNESDLSQEMPMTPSKTTASSPKTSGDNLADANSEPKKGGKTKMLMYIDRDFDNNVSLAENGSKMVTKGCKEIVSCFKVINEAEGTKEDKPTILIDRRQTEKTVTFKDDTQETLILRKEAITYPANHSSGDDVPTKEYTVPSSPAKSPRQVSDQPKSEAVTVTSDESFVQLSDPKNLDSLKQTRQGTDTALKALSEIVVIETYDVLVELGEHPNLFEDLGPKEKEKSASETPELKHGVSDISLEERAEKPNQSTRPESDVFKWKPEMGKNEVQEFVTIETTEVVVEVVEYQPSSHRPNWFGPKKSGNPNEEMPKAKPESSPAQHPKLSGKPGSKKSEEPKEEMPELQNTMETLTIDISEFVIQKIQK